MTTYQHACIVAAVMATNRSARNVPVSSKRGRVMGATES
jgi:hypothetical protein